MAGLMSDPESWRIRAIDGRFAWLDDHADGWQFGETGFLRAICDRIGVDQAVEIGAGDGTDALPLTLGFLCETGLPSLLFEKNEDSRAKLKERYPLADVRGEWPLRTPPTDSIFGRACVVIDVDSIDYLIADQISTGLSGGLPAVICVEHYDLCALFAKCSGVPPMWLMGMQLSEGGFIIQAQMCDIESMMIERGFVLVGFSRVNSVYVRNDLLGTLEGC